MDSLQLMVEEHQNIKRMLAVIRKYCYRILKNEPVRVEDFYTMTDFVKNYADRHHHGKEEQLLFERMEKELGQVAQKLVRHGMMVEHDLGRLYIQQLETAVGRVINGEDEARLDLIANAISYTDLLHRHIDKEDAVVYKFARDRFERSSLEAINEACEQFEQQAEVDQTQSRYANMIAAFEAKVRYW